jgi:hypothetical protein
MGEVLKSRRDYIHMIGGLLMTVTMRVLSVGVCHVDLKSQ